MKVVVAEHAGFCFGVERALKKAETAIQEHQTNVYTLGPLIHNPQVIARLQENGAKIVDSVAEVEDGTVIIRSHGVDPKIIEEAKVKGLNVVDATCPYVKRLHEQAKLLKEQGYAVVIVGEKDHPEVQGLLGTLNHEATVVLGPEDLKDQRFDKVGVVAQTTQSHKTFRDCVAYLVDTAREIRVFPTICQATESRQNSAVKLAGEVDVMIVVGGKTSGNTRRLYELCLEVLPRVYHIERPDELEADWFKPTDTVGITAGASTPDWVIEGVVERMSEMEKQEMQDVMPAAEESSEENQAVMMEELEKSQLKKGEVLEVTVVSFDKDGVYVDVGQKEEGFIPLRELSYRYIESPDSVVSIGQKINVVVDRVEDGRIILSKKDADRETAWEFLTEAKAEGKVFSAQVVEKVKGGLLVDIGVRGFVPASHVSRQFVEDLDQFVGQTMDFKVLELEEERKNVVLSHRLVEEEELEKKKQEVFDSLEAGQIVDGVVRRITDFGAFVDIGSGVEGLLHVSEMAWSRVDHPSDVVSEGDKIKVKILALDKDKDRISLGLKQTNADPWSLVESKYAVGEIVEGTVTRVVDFGCFVKLEDGVEGLVHISQLAHHRVAEASEVVKPGDTVKVKVLNVDSENRRIGLSIREALPQPEKPAKPAGGKKREPKQPEKVEVSGDEPFGTTIGSQFSELEALKKQLEGN
ncbi:MAG: bifunctional 4-hydroxy-3-methylbut-2-enyl diphosphate reductase/30S ribosomal protein S1 [Bacillota bacterium]|nr:bifunctional 4-hydroxy-3-methylbut-2-enyl diphosphate reductase/30S ribosomal protein S1 [Bacillota bacterium]HOA90863.1 bifunctional 4-hydroxy-3-methylbut-2-enyl diphosphate reductase/30S ribosomal protein S1 [Bacillota bacterium]HPZ72534.1 bifunctional 4-hydroxy-3-methylbut-2-enyl diphosphate reductase/30S ribosomal protein S1 [Bacillota bacterium]HQD77501.1 bifunctional 4-hydroxy-3-methylbut-2-enyl diphosphate reductase/30S ribosomal protein S1 [Bacillota bacterium]